MPPFDTADWKASRDWEMDTSRDDTPEELKALFDDAVARADRQIDAALAKPTGLDTLSVRPRRGGDEHFSLRWILTHMIEEYARHNGHADLIREAVDGQRGD